MNYIANYKKTMDSDDCRGKIPLQFYRLIVDIDGKNMYFGVSDMKIDGTSMSPLGSVQASNRLKQVEKKTPVAEADKVAVSDKAQVFQALLQKTKDIPAVREGRVRVLAEQIERGEFKVDGQKIADKLLLKY